SALRRDREIQGEAGDRGVRQRQSLRQSRGSAAQAGLQPGGLALRWNRSVAAGRPAGGKVMAKITMYSTAVCPFCVRAERLLNSKGITEIVKIRVELDPVQREEMMAKTGRRTVPQVDIGDRCVATVVDR